VLARDGHRTPPCIRTPSVSQSTPSTVGSLRWSYRRAPGGLTIALFTVVTLFANACVSVTILSLNLNTWDLTSVSLSRDVRVPELEEPAYSSDPVDDYWWFVRGAVANFVTR
jgi:hypothetical protein